MNHPTYFGTANLSLLNLSRSPLRRGFPVVLLALALGWFALSQFAQAQDGDEGRSNTAEGGGALHTYITTATSATQDTAIGFDALFSDTTGNINTATGAVMRSLRTQPARATQPPVLGRFKSNTTASDNTANGAFALTSNTTGN